MVVPANFLRGAPKPRTRHLVLLLLISAISLVDMVRLAAETVLTTDLTFQGALGRRADGWPGLSALSNGKLNLSSRGSDQIKGMLELEILAADTILLDVNRAFLKARLADIRLTMGKTRLTWGEGVLFNTGDVIFGGDGVNLSNEDIHNTNKWLLALYFPLGDYSFVETVVLPQDLPLQGFLNKAMHPNDLTVVNPSLPDPQKTSYGGRIYGKIEELKVEGGYLFDGVRSLHKPYVSVQGNLWADWELSSAVSLDAMNPFAEYNRDTWEISGGFYYQLPLTPDTGDSELTETPNNGNLNFRLEARVRPFGSWTTHSLKSLPYNPLLSTSTDNPWAFSLYPEISLKSDAWFVYARSIVSPLDASALTSVGGQWAPLQGFKILLGFSWQMGAAGDVYQWDRAGGWQALLGTQIIF